MVNWNTVSTIKIFLNSTTFAFPFLSYLNANNFSSLMAVNIFFKIYIMCILILSHTLYWGSYPWNWARLILGNPVFSTVPNTFWVLSEKKNGKFTLLINGCVIWIVVYNLGPIHKIFKTNPYWEKYSYWEKVIETVIKIWHCCSIKICGQYTYLTEYGMQYIVYINL